MIIGKIPNFSEYGLKGDFTSFNLPNAFSTSFTPYIHRLRPNSKICSKRGETQ